jgi:hypothetical protein
LNQINPASGKTSRFKPKASRSKVLQAAKGIFNLMPFPIPLFAEPELLLAIASVRYDGPGAAFSQSPAQFSAVIGFVTEHGICRLGCLNQCSAGRAVMRLATCKRNI